VEAFDRLSPALQYQVVNGWAGRGLRPVQEQSTHAILDGANCVILAPTAGGKTEAALLPLLSRMNM
jgi:ATP-dependent Lhr-like helicase